MIRPHAPVAAAACYDAKVRTPRACVGAALLAAACGFDSHGAGSGAAEIGEASASDDVADASDGPTAGPGSSATMDATDPDDTGSVTLSGSDDASDDSSGSASTTGGFQWGPWEDPQPLTMLNSDGSDDDPTLRGDLLEIVFASMRMPNISEELMFSTRASTADEFGPPQYLPAPINEYATNETTPEISLDGLVLTFASDRAGTADIYVTFRESVDLTWGPVMRIEELATVDNEAALATSDDGLFGVFCRFTALNAEQLFITTRPTTLDLWGGFVELTINSPERDCSPWVAPDGGELWFSSARIGGDLNDDIFFAPIEGGVVGEPQVVEDLRSAVRDEDPWLSAAGDLVVFASERAGTLDLYWSVRAPK
jgi:hypothetical protein